MSKLLCKSARKGDHGVKQLLELYVTFADGNDGALTFDDEVLPPGAIVDSCTHQVLEAFNAGTTNVITVGDNGTADRYKAAGDINEAATGAPIDLVNGYQVPAATVRIPQVRYDYTGNIPTTGKIRVQIWFHEADLMP